MRVCCIQFYPVWQDEHTNLTHLKALFAAQVAPQKPTVVVLPELFHCGFTMDSRQVMQRRSGQVYHTLSQLAKDYTVTVIAGVALQVDASIKADSLHAPAFNSALVFDKHGDEQACYIKNYAFTSVGEQYHYQQAGQQVLFNIDSTPCTVFICYDLRFPELFRKLSLQAELVFVIANWPESRQAHWQALLTARAIENQCFVVGVNRIGEDGNGLKYAGGSMVVSPVGDILCLMDAQSEVKQVDIDTTMAQETRAQWPFLNDIKPS